MTRFENLQAAIVEANPEALFADGFEDALIGLANRCGQPTLAVYDYALAVKLLIKRDGMDYEEACEFLDFNTVGAWVGEHTPIWLTRHDEGDDDELA